jgi:hypothetical protein
MPKSPSPLTSARNEITVCLPKTKEEDILMVSNSTDPKSARLAKTHPQNKSAGSMINVVLPNLGRGVTFLRDISQYVFLPDHRPPLRQDRSVRILMPSSPQPPAYIYPAPWRSFEYKPGFDEEMGLDHVTHQD